MAEYSTDEFIKRVGVPRCTLINWRGAGHITIGRRVGCARVYTDEDVQQVLAYKAVPHPTAWSRTRPPGTYTSDELIKLVGISMSTLHRWQCSHIFTGGKKAGGIRYYTDDDVRAARALVDEKHERVALNEASRKERRRAERARWHASAASAETVSLSVYRR